MEIQKLVGKVCDRNWGMKEANVVCRQLGCGSALKVSYQSYSKIKPTNMWLFLMRCVGNETSIWDCKNWQWGGLNCDHYEEAKVTCSGKTFFFNTHPRMFFSLRESGREGGGEGNIDVSHIDWLPPASVLTGAGKQTHDPLVYKPIFTLASAAQLTLSISFLRNLI